MNADDLTIQVPSLNPEMLLGNKPLNTLSARAAHAHRREAAGYLPTQVTLRVQGDIKLAELEAALAGKFEVYKDYTEALCLRTVADGDEHRALLRREREARLDHARRHAALVRQEGERNRANGYKAPQP